MKRYLVFFGKCFYPSGGMGDYIGACNTKQEAIEMINNEIAKQNIDEDSAIWDFHFCHVYDLVTQTTLLENLD